MCADLFEPLELKISSNKLMSILGLTVLDIQTRNDSWIVEGACQGCHCYFEAHPMAAQDWLSLERWSNPNDLHSCKCHAYPARMLWRGECILWKLSLLAPYDVASLLPGEPVASDPAAGTTQCQCGQDGEAFVVCHAPIRCRTDLSGSWICCGCLEIDLPSHDYRNRSLNVGQIAIEFQNLRNLVHLPAVL